MKGFLYTLHVTTCISYKLLLLFMEKVIIVLSEKKLTLFSRFVCLFNNHVNKKF